MGTAENAIGGGPSSSIPQFPDEILLRIFEIIRDDIMELGAFSGIAVGANSSLRVNRRFYTLLRSSWFSTLLDRSEASARIARVLKQPLILTWIRELSVTFQSASPPYDEFANLNRLVNLHKLTVRFQHRSYLHGDEQTINVGLMLQPLDKLSRLVDLDFSSTFKTSFASLSFVKIAPILQHLGLSVRGCDTLYNALSTCPNTLQRLELATAGTPLQGYEWNAVPWKSLHEISLGSSFSTWKGKRGLLDALERALYPVTPRIELFTPRAIPLESLRIEFAVPSKSEEYFDLRDLYDLVGLLKSTSVKRLAIELNGGDVQEWGVPIAAPSVEKLTLFGGYYLREGSNFATLRRIICSFPSLRVLHLQWFQISDDSSIAEAIMGLDRGSLAFYYPELGGTLHYLALNTQVLEVIYQEFDAQEWVKWCRILILQKNSRKSYIATTSTD